MIFGQAAQLKLLLKYVIVLSDETIMKINMEMAKKGVSIY